MAKNAMHCLLILSVVIALAFATNKNDDKESENHSTGIFGKVGRVVTVALAMSSRLEGAGASRGGGAVHVKEAPVDGLKFNRLPNNNWMALPPPMVMRSAKVYDSKHSAENLKKFAQNFRRKTGTLQRLKQENRVAVGGPDPIHHKDETPKQENRVAVGGPDPKHHH
uniref:CLAVATA3/ESR-related protein n=1 Tax=Globodera tabacum ssp. 'azteca' TaxID=462285 RepID=V5R7C3_GLOTB|nr:CLAVATA3/ESR-related protein [Globodera tabacum ssp. 'azteca']